MGYFSQDGIVLLTMAIVQAARQQPMLHFHKRVFHLDRFFHNPRLMIFKPTKLLISS